MQHLLDADALESGQSSKQTKTFSLGNTKYSKISAKKINQSIGLTKQFQTQNLSPHTGEYVGSVKLEDIL